MGDVRVAWGYVKWFLKAALTVLACQFAFNHRQFEKFWGEFGLAGILEVAVGAAIFIALLFGANYLWALFLLELQKDGGSQSRVVEPSSQRWHRRGRALGLKFSGKKLRIEE